MDVTATMYDMQYLEKVWRRWTLTICCLKTWEAVEAQHNHHTRLSGQGMAAASGDRQAKAIRTTLPSNFLHQCSLSP